MSEPPFRDELSAYLGSRSKRKKILEDIKAVERDLLGLPEEDPSKLQARQAEQLSHVSSISQPLHSPEKTFTDFLRAPRSLRAKGSQSKDVLFHPPPESMTQLEINYSQSPDEMRGGPSISSIPSSSTAASNKKNVPAGGGGGGGGDRASGTRKVSMLMGRSGSLSIINPQPQQQDPATASLTSPVGRKGSMSGGAFLTSLSPSSTSSRAATHAKKELNTITIVNPAAPSKNFWLYASQKVSQSTLGSTNQFSSLTAEDIRHTPVAHFVRAQIDALMSIAERRPRCGILFDIISTSKIISSGIPHEIGAFIYDHIEKEHYETTSLKFIFVGITDNVNCCAARDVFCRDDTIDTLVLSAAASGQKQQHAHLESTYVGDTKRPYTALDNVHMFTVFPGDQLHPFSRSLVLAQQHQQQHQQNTRGGAASRESPPARTPTQEQSLSEQSPSS